MIGGDPMQLGPVVFSPFTKKYGLSVSLLERLMTNVMYTPDEALKYDERCITMLKQNYRSHCDLIVVPNRLFYKGQLIPSESSSITDSCLNMALLPNSAPLLFHGVLAQEMREGHSNSFFNPSEVIIATDYVSKIVTEGIKPTAIGVISPYSKQVEKIKKKLANIGLSDVTVGTVENFQGQERQVIVISTVRSSPSYLLPDSGYQCGFLSNPKKVNVAITRSMALLVVVGCPLVLKQV